ncbi:MAG: helix-turn-helix domain-containing protein [Bacteroidaceae bacterium]|nr:helix-turn-helix domain-containing protein [Bacteroidaceae bacterium]
MNKEQERRRIGAQITEIRKKEGISQKELAELCGIKQGHVCRIEKGYYSFGLDALATIGEALGVQLNYTEIKN